MLWCEDDQRCLTAQGSVYILVEMLAGLVCHVRAGRWRRLRRKVHCPLPGWQGPKRKVRAGRLHTPTLKLSCHHHSMYFKQNLKARLSLVRLISSSLPPGTWLQSIVCGSLWIVVNPPRAINCEISMFVGDAGCWCHAHACMWRHNCTPTSGSAATWHQSQMSNMMMMLIKASNIAGMRMLRQLSWQAKE